MPSTTTYPAVSTQCKRLWVASGSFLFSLVWQLDCETMRWRRVRCPSCKGVVNDPASPSHDRGHANPQPDAQHATGLCRAGCPVCSPFPPLTEYLGPAEI